MHKHMRNGINVKTGPRCATNADCRLAAWQTYRPATCRPAYFWIFATFVFNENYVLPVVLLIPWSVDWLAALRAELSPEACVVYEILRAKISHRNFEI